MTPRLKILLIVLAILLSGVAIEKLIFTDNAPVIAERPSTLIAKTAANTHNKNKPLPNTTELLPPLKEFSEIWQRPLFAPSRKAETVVITRVNSTTARTTSNDQSPQFIIVGVAIKPGGGSVIIKKSRQEVIRVLVGEEVDGWQVDKLNPQFVTMSKNGESWQIPVGEQ
ncbi:MAG: hypothetical protein COA60_002490 [Robiginitomaculum sp.]|nr:hypothetical protein [Robiginitomaculum sp.]